MRISTANAFDTGIDIALAPPGRDGRRCRSSSRPASGSAAPATIRPPRRAPSGRWRASAAAETSQRAVEASKVADDADREQPRRRRHAAAAGARADGRRPATPATAMPSGRSIANELQSLRQQLFAVANQSDGAGTYLFGGQGATQKPFIDTPTGVQYVAATGQTVTERRHRPAADDRRRGRLAAGAHRQRRVRDERRADRPERDDRQRQRHRSRRADRRRLHARSSASPAASRPMRSSRTACRRPSPPRPTSRARRSRSTA